jgi:hypothetical protein
LKDSHSGDDGSLRGEVRSRVLANGRSSCDDPGGRPSLDPLYVAELTRAHALPETKRGGRRQPFGEYVHVEERLEWDLRGTGTCRTRPSAIVIVACPEVVERESAVCGRSQQMICCDGQTLIR